MQYKDGGPSLGFGGGQGLSRLAAPSVQAQRLACGDGGVSSEPFRQSQPSGWPKGRHWSVASSFRPSSVTYLLCVLGQVM